MAVVTFASSARSSARQPENVQQPLDRNPRRLRVVIAQAELVFLAGHRQALDQADAAVHAGQAAAAIVDPPRDDLEAQAGLAADVPAQQARIEIGPQRVDVVQEQILQLRPLRRAAGPACRCGACWAPRTSGRWGAGIAAARCRCSRCRRRPLRPSRSARRAGSRGPFGPARRESAAAFPPRQSAGRGAWAPSAARPNGPARPAAARDTPCPAAIAGKRSIGSCVR